MTKTLNRLTIGSIFEKDGQGKYTIDAEISQYILRYYRANNNTILSNSPFTLRDLQNWIALNYPGIKDTYVGFKAHTPKKSRRFEHATKIEGRFNDLIQLKLIRISTRGKLYSTGSLYVEDIFYEYTRAGIFLALIIESLNCTEEMRILENIYDCLVDLVFKVNEDSLASNVFYSTLIKKCKDKGVFDKFVEYIRYIINNTSNDITSILNLFGRTINFVFFNNEKQEPIFTNILIETIEELEEKDRKLILNRLKMLVEEDYENSQEDLTREYEEFRFESRNDYAHVAIQGYCENCRIKRNLKLHYLDLRRISINDNKRIDCPACNNKNVAIPRLYY